MSANSKENYSDYINSLWTLIVWIGSAILAFDIYTPNTFNRFLVSLIITAVIGNFILYFTALIIQAIDDNHQTSSLKTRTNKSSSIFKDGSSLNIP